MPNAQMQITKRKTEFSTPWFQLVAKSVAGDSSGKPYYSLEMSDYVAVIAVTDKKEILVVKQYRPSVEKYTLEFPSGHVDDGERPEEAARRELHEETGYKAGAMELLGALSPDTGRSSNKNWYYFAPNVKLDPAFTKMEEGIELIKFTEKEFKRSIEKFRFDHAIHVAGVMLAVMQKKIFKEKPSGRKHARRYVKV